MAALIRLPPPEVNTAILHSLSASDTWKDSVIEQHLPARPAEDLATTGDPAASGSPKLGTPHTGIAIDDKTFRQHLTLVARTPEEIHEIPLNLNEGETLVLEQYNAVEVKEGGFPVMVVRYRVEP